MSKRGFNYLLIGAGKSGSSQQIKAGPVKRREDRLTYAHPGENAHLLQAL